MLSPANPGTHFLGLEVQIFKFYYFYFYFGIEGKVQTPQASCFESS